MDEKFSSLASDVEQIKNNTATFGTKLPSGKGNELTYTEILIKGVSCALFGKKLSDVDNFDSYFDPSKSLYTIITQIRDSVNTIKSNKLDTLSKNIISVNNLIKMFKDDLLNKLKNPIPVIISNQSSDSENESTNKILPSNIDFNELKLSDKSIDGLIKSFKNDLKNNPIPVIINNQSSDSKNKSTNKILPSNIDFNGFIKSVDNFTKTINDILINIENDKRLDFIFNFDIDTGDLEKFSKIDSKIFKDISNIIDPENKNFKRFIESLQKLNLQKIEGLEDISKFLSSFVSILSMNKIKDKNIELIYELTNETGYLTRIVQNLQDQIWKKQINSNTKKNIETLESLFEALSKIVELKYWDIKKSNFILNYINKDYFNKIKNIIENTNSLYIYSDKVNIDDKIEALTDIIDIIPKIASVSIFDMLWSRISIKYLNDYITNDIPTIFKALGKTLSKYKNSYKDIEQLSICINSILKIFELDQKNIDESSENIDMISDIMSGELKDLFEKISENYNEQNLEKILTNIENIHGILEMLDFNDALPSIMSLIKTSIKLSLIQEETNIVNDILNPKKYPYINFKRENKTDEIIENLKQFKKVLKVLEDTNRSLENVNIKSVIKVLSRVRLELIVIDNVFKKLQSIDEEYTTEIKFTGIKKTIKNFNNSLDLLKISYDEEISKISGISSLIDSFLMLLNEIDTEGLSDKSETIGDFIVNSMSEILKKFKKGSDLDVSVRAMMLVDTKYIENIENIEKIITKLALISSSKLLSKISKTGLTALVNAADKLYNVVNKLKDIKEEDVKGANKTLTMLMKVVLGSAAILLIGAVIIKYINHLDLITFTLVLGGFITGVLKVYSKLSKDTLKSSFSAAYNLSLLIAISGATLIFGSLLFHLIDFKDLLGYTFALAAFMFAIIGTYRLFNKQIKNTFSAAYDLGILIAISGGTLVFCSLIYRLVRWQDITGFILALGSFMTMILGIYAIFNKWFKNTLRGTKDFAYLIMVSGGLMILGALLFDFVIKNFGRIFGFGLLLSLYVGMICLPWILGGPRMRKAMKNAKEFAYLVMVCAGVLILGPIIIDLWSKGNYWEGFLKILGFAVILGAFIIGMGVALKLASRVKNLLPNAIALMAMVIIAGAVLVAGPVILKEKDISMWEVLGFAAILIGFTFFMGIALEHLEEIKWNTIIKGIVTMGAILLITYLSALVIEEIRNAVGDKHGEYWLQLAEGVAGIFLVIAAVGSGAIGIGTLLTGATFGIGAGVLAAGIAAILGIALAAYVSISVVGAIRTQMKEIGNIETVKNDVNSLMGIIIYTGEKIASAFDVKQLLKIKASVGAFKNIGEALSLIGQGIKDWSDLRIVSKYDKKGRPIEYISITSGLFQKAKNNIAKTVLALAEAIVDVYDHAKDKKVFADPTGIGFLDSPFAIIMKSLRYMGDGLTSTAKGIKQWSNLKFPVKFDKKGNPTEYESLVNADFTNLSGNIRLVLEALGNAIVKVVETDKNGIFDDGLLTKSKAAVAVQSIKVMGDVLNNTALAIACYASDQFPIFDKNGNIIKKQNGEIEYITINSTKISNAEEKIKEVLTALGNAINNVVNGPNKTLFQDYLGTDAPAIVAAEAMSNMGNALNTMIDVIKKLNEIKLENINLKDIKEKIGKLLGGTISIMSLFMKPSKNHLLISNNGRGGLSGWFKDMWSGDQTYADYINENLSDIIEATKAIDSLVNLLNPVFESIAGLGKLLSENDEHLKYLANSTNFVTTLNNTFDSINLINKTLYAKLRTKIYDLTNKQTISYAEFNKNVENIIKSLKSLFKSIDEFIVDYNKHVKTYSSFKNKNVHIQTISNTMSDLIAILNKYGGISDETYKNYKKFLSFLNDYTKSLNILIESLNKFDKSFNPNLELLKSGIIGLYNITSTINDSNVEIFSQYVSDIHDFIESVEEIDLSKFNAMTSLIQALNELSGKVGNLDEFVDGLSEKLTAVLYELVTQLRKAEATINNAHELQNRRKILIDNSINKVKDIMSQHMVVEVLKGDETRNNPSLGGGGGNYSGGNSGTPTDNNKEDSLESPENASPLQPKDDAESVKAKSGWSADALTKDSFIEIMNQNFKKWLDGQGNVV